MNKILKQLFCNHDYRIPKELDDEEDRNKLVAELKQGEMISFSRLHRCTKCNKERIIGSGLIS